MAMVEIRDLRKVYDNAFEALKGVTLDIEEGEILALLGPNGAGKTTLISTVCGTAKPTSGSITVGGNDIAAQFRAARRLIGYVPQEIHLEPFETVWNTVQFSRGLFGLARNDALVTSVLEKLSLLDKKDQQLRALSGGMRRRVLIAKALAHEPRVLFLDEPTAGVDVALRRGMWDVVEELKADGVTIILTTHYIEEAEALADRIGVIRKGEILLVEETQSLMTRMGQKELTIDLYDALETLPEGLAQDGLRLSDDKMALIYTYDTSAERTGIGRLMAALTAEGIAVRDLSTEQNSLEDIFVGLVEGGSDEGEKP